MMSRSMQYLRVCAGRATKFNLKNHQPCLDPPHQNGTMVKDTCCVGKDLLAQRACAAYDESKSCVLCNCFTY